MTGTAARGVDLSWIVVAHDSARDLPVLLRSLAPALAKLAEQGFTAELLVVDNHSSDGSAEVVRRLAPWARLLRNSSNQGYGAAINRALVEVRGRWVAFGNADLFVPNGGLDSLPAVLAGAAPEVALVGPSIFCSDGLPSLSAGRFPCLRTLLAGLFRACHRRKYLHERRHRAGRVDWVTGACLFARAEHLAAVNGFDESFFLYYEDVDLARRLASRGLSTVYDPRVRVVHVRPHHGRPPVPAIEAHVCTSRRLWFDRHRPSWERTALSLLGKLEPLVRRRSRLSPAPPSLPRPNPHVVRVITELDWRGGPLPDPAAAAAPVAPARQQVPVPVTQRAVRALAVAEDALDRGGRSAVGS